MVSSTITVDDDDDDDAAVAQPHSITTMTHQLHHDASTTTTTDTTNNTTTTNTPSVVVGDIDDTTNKNTLADSIIIPITSYQKEDRISSTTTKDVDDTKNTDHHYIEIFPEELSTIPVTTLVQVLQTEQAPIPLYTDAAVGYVQPPPYYYHHHPGTDTSSTTTSGSSNHYNRLRDALVLLQAASEEAPTRPNQSTIDDKYQTMMVRIYAATGICHLGLATFSAGMSSSTSSTTTAMSGKSDTTTTDHHTSTTGTGTAGSNSIQVQREIADQKFTQATAIDQLYPMTWIGKGMYHLNISTSSSGSSSSTTTNNSSSNNNAQQQAISQAKFFFQTTVKECGPVLPGLLGMAAVLYHEKKYQNALTMYSEAIRRYPQDEGGCGASIRVGLAVCCYQLGQVDRAKAAFHRALQLDPENVPAMVGAAVLDMASSKGGSRQDGTNHTNAATTESAIKRMSMANLIDHNNAMVQNHLANHYFWKWTAVTGTVSVQTGSNRMISTQPISFDVGEPIRIGSKFETTILQVFDDGDDVDEDGKDGNSTVHQYKIGNAWKDVDTSGLKVWKKDYERVFALAKGAYSSTSVPEIQAESLFFLARVYHVREDNDNALKFYERACKLSPTLTPARFGLAQTLVVQERYDDAIKELKQLLTLSSHATDAYALLGLLQVRKGWLSNNGQISDEGLFNLHKAMEYDPANPELVVLEALALQQHKSDYPKALQRYQKAVDLMQRRNTPVPYHIYTNLGVLLHELRQYDQALDMYRNALTALSDSHSTTATTSVTPKTALLQNIGMDGIRVQEPENFMFYDYVDLVGFEATMVDPNHLKLLNAKQSDIDVMFLSVGDHIQLDNMFETEIVTIDVSESGVEIEFKDVYDPMIEKENDEAATTTVPIAVKRENNLFDIAEATTVAFNIARLHEASGKILAAIELHKAIAKRNPAYVNSYLRLACIAVDCGSLNECAQWLKIAAASAPGNSEVLTLIGNLHLSLCDWKPAQKVFDGLMAQKIASVEAYSALSMGNIYFANLHVSEQRYSKHLQYASDYYKRILSKDPLNAYAANGIGTVLAEKGELFKAKEAFNRVREVSGDSIADALLNLGHIYLAQKKHPEALQLYKSYMKRSEDGATPVTSKSRADDDVEVLLYIAFAYFDWARHTELFNDINAAPADERYKQAMEHLQQAISMQSRNNTVLQYNLCMTKLQAANCVLQKLTRNIPRTVEEVDEALTGLIESQKIVEDILKEKEEGGKKINIRSSILEDFLKHCRANIASAQSHLEDEKKRAEEEKDDQEIRRRATEIAQQEAQLREAIRNSEEAAKQEERDQRAEAMMQKVEDLRSGWQHEQAAAEAAKAKRSKVVENQELEEDNQQTTRGLFDDSDDESDVADPVLNNATETNPVSHGDLFGDTDSEDDVAPATSKKESTEPIVDDDSDGDVEFEGGAKKADLTNDLFGDSDDDSDEELVPAKSKRGPDESNNDGDVQNKKKQRLNEEDDEE